MLRIEGATDVMRVYLDNCSLQRPLDDDDRLMKRLKVIASITIAIVTPLELIQEVLP
jgi:hypothetical protein